MDILPSAIEPRPNLSSFDGGYAKGVSGSWRSAARLHVQYGARWRSAAEAAHGAVGLQVLEVAVPGGVAPADDAGVLAGLADELALLLQAEFAVEVAGDHLLVAALRPVGEALDLVVE